jgi:hypothetical protein
VLALRGLLLEHLNYLKMKKKIELFVKTKKNYAVGKTLFFDPLYRLGESYYDNFLQPKKNDNYQIRFALHES